MAKQNQNQNVNKSEKGFINITTESTEILKSTGSELFDMGKVLDTDIANMLKKYTIRKKTEVSGTSSSFSVAGVTSDELPDMFGCMLLPSLGGIEGAKRAQLAFKDQFVNAVGDAYYKSDVSETDLMKLFMYNESLGALLMWVGLGLNITEQYSKVNAPICQGILRVLGLPYSMLVTDRQRWIDCYNRLVGLLNSKFYLVSNAAIEQYYYLLNHIFLDGNSQKAQPILFRPVLYTDIDEIDGTLRPDSETFSGGSALLSQPQLTLATFELIVSRAEDFSTSAWYSEVAPILFHLYGDNEKGLFKFSNYEYKKLAFTFNYQVLLALRNGRLANGMVASDSSNTGFAVIWEDQNGYIHQGAKAVSSDEVKGMLTPSIYNYSDSDHTARWFTIPDHICNLDFFPSANADKVDAHAFYFIERPAHEIDSSTTIIKPYNYIEWSSHVLLIGFSSFKLNTMDGSMDENPITDYIVVANGPSNGFNSVKCTVYTGSAYISKIAAITSNNCSKNCYLIDASGGQQYQISVSKVTPYVHDKDNLVYIGDDILKNFYIQLTYDCMTFEVPSFTSRK